MKRDGSKMRGSIKGSGASRPRGVVFGISVDEEDKEMARRIAERSGLSLSGVVRALIRLHAEDTLHVQQTVHVDTVVKVEKP